MAKKHPGITMHKISIGPGIMGLVFTIGCGLIFVIGLPALWSFVAFSAALGIAIALLLQMTSQHRSEGRKPLSITQTAEKAKSRDAQDDRTRSLLQSLPGLVTP